VEAVDRLRIRGTQAAQRKPIVARAIGRANQGVEAILRDVPTDDGPALLRGGEDVTFPIGQRPDLLAVGAPCVVQDVNELVQQIDARRRSAATTWVRVTSTRGTAATGRTCPSQAGRRPPRSRVASAWTRSDRWSSCSRTTSTRRRCSNAGQPEPGPGRRRLAPDPVLAVPGPGVVAAPGWPGYCRPSAVRTCGSYPRGRSIGSRPTAASRIR
jgi:hypothetical protein